VRIFNADDVRAAGDGFFLAEVRKQNGKGWVSKIWIPYIVFFALACLVSVLALGTKLVLLVQTIRSRVHDHAVSTGVKSSRGNRISIGGVQVAPAMFESQASMNAGIKAFELKEKFDQCDPRTSTCLIRVCCGLSQGRGPMFS
jgi:hypothetical protein